MPLKTREPRFEWRVSTVLLVAAVLSVLSAFIAPWLDKPWPASDGFVVGLFQLVAFAVFSALSVAAALSALVLLAWKRRWQFAIELLIALAMGFACLRIWTSSAA